MYCLKSVPISQASASEIGQNPEDDQAILSLALVVNKIDFTLEILQRPTPMQKFCWRIIGQLCKELPSTRSFALFQTKFKRTTTLICPLHVKYCEHKGSSKQITDSADLPNDLKNSLPQTQAYFEWVRNTQSFLLRWKNKLQNHSVNYGEIHEYKHYYSNIVGIAKALDCEMCVYDNKALEDLSSDFDLKQVHVGEILIQKSREHSHTLW